MEFQIEYGYMILLSVNAFFIRSLIASLNELKIQVVKISIQHGQVSETAKENRAKLAIVEVELARCKERLHSIESEKNQG
jgi:hypothetical protein